MRKLFYIICITTILILGTKAIANYDIPQQVAIQVMLTSDDDTGPLHKGI